MSANGTEFGPAQMEFVLGEERPAVGIVLGSGLGSFAGQMEVRREVEYGEVFGMPQCRVEGHAGKFVFGDCGGVSVVAAQGRVHLYEGRTTREVTAPVRCLAAMGVGTLILTNAAGTVNSSLNPGRWMMLRDHLNLTGASPLLGGLRFVDMSEVYDEELRKRFVESAKELEVPLHQGIYAGVVGPQYETPAEIRMLRMLGADAVGMSTVLEAIQSRALGLRTAAFSCLTNHGAGLAPGRKISHEDVLAQGAACASDLFRLMRAVLPSIAELETAD